MDKLLPCPFCGGEGEYDNADEYSGGKWISCKTCGARAWSGYNTKPDCFEKWNRRTPAPQAQEETRGAPAPLMTHVAADRDMGRPQPPAPASPAALVWTKEKPKVDGWYCYRVFGERAWAVAEIRMFTGAPCWHSAERHAWVPITWDLEWAGPIPEPAAPEAGAPGTQEGGSQP